MKVIGKGEHTGEYICTVGHTELEKLAGKYYGKLESLKVGSEMNLGAGYDFSSEIKEACRGMAEAIPKFERAQATMFRFAIMVKDLPIDAPVVEALK